MFLYKLFTKISFVRIANNGIASVFVPICLIPPCLSHPKDIADLIWWFNPTVTIKVKSKWNTPFFTTMNRRWLRLYRPPRHRLPPIQNRLDHRRIKQNRLSLYISVHDFPSWHSFGT
jgi:hypothetical protein